MHESCCYFLFFITERVFGVVQSVISRGADLRVWFPLLLSQDTQLEVAFRVYHSSLPALQS